MVHIKSGALKNASGRHGEMIVYKIGNETYGRKAPTVDGNAGSPTRAAQNSRLSSVVTLYQSIKNTLLESVWRMEARNKNILSGYNLFVKTNMKAYNIDYTVGDFTLLSLTVGTLQIPFHLRQETAALGTCSLTWDISPWMPTPRASDQLMAAVIYDNEPFRVEIIGNTGATRHDGEASLSLSSPEASEAHVYCFFANKNCDSFTDSVYFNVKLGQQNSILDANVQTFND